MGLHGVHRLDGVQEGGEQAGSLLEDGVDLALEGIRPPNALAARKANAPLERFVSIGSVELAPLLRAELVVLREVFLADGLPRCCVDSRKVTDPAFGGQLGEGTVAPNPRGAGS